MSLALSFRLNPFKVVPGIPTKLGEFFGGMRFLNAVTHCIDPNGRLVTGHNLNNLTNPTGTTGVPNGTSNFYHTVALHDTAVSKLDPPDRGRLIRSANSANTTRIRVFGTIGVSLSVNNDRLTLYDMSSPDAIVEKGSVSNGTTLDAPRHVEIDATGQYLFVTCFNRLTTVDISNINSPTIANSLLDSTRFRGAGGMVRSGNTLFIACGSGTPAVRSYNITTPTSPTHIFSQSTFTADADNYPAIAMVGTDIHYCGNTDFVVIGASNPAAMTFRGHIVSSSINGSFVGSQFAIVHIGSLRFACIGGNSNNTLTIINASTPTAPTVASTVSVDAALTFSMAPDLSYLSPYVYIGGTSQGMWAIDVSTPTSPISTRVTDRGSIWTVDQTEALAGIVYTSGEIQNSIGRNLAGIDATNEANIFLSGFYSGFSSTNLGGMITRRGSTIYSVTVFGVLACFDISTPTPVLLGSVTNTNLSGSPTGIAISADGSYAYTTHGSTNKFSITNVSNTAAPSYVSSVTGLSAVTTPCVLQSGHVAVIRPVLQQMDIIDVSVPSSPVVVGNNGSTFFASARGTVPYGNNVIVLQVGGVSKWDCATLTPTLVDDETISGGQDMTISGDYLYVVGNTGNYYVIDVSDVTLSIVQTLIDTVNLPYPTRVAIEGNHLYVTSYHHQKLYVLQV